MRQILIRWLILLRNRSQERSRIQHLFTRASQKLADPSKLDEHNVFQLQRLQVSLRLRRRCHVALRLGGLLASR